MQKLFNLKLIRKLYFIFNILSKCKLFTILFLFDKTIT